MKLTFFLRYALLLLLPAAAIAATPADKPYEPQVGQEGKDVIWVPTPLQLIDKMLTMTKVTPADYVIDLGSGDGRTVIAAAKRGARAMGIEYNPDMVELSKRNAAKEGVSDKATYVKADIFETDFSQATVITMYLLPSLNMRLRPKILDLKPGTRIVSHAFTMEEWTPDQTDNFEGRTAYMWIVPAKIEGNWKMPQGELNITQSFQRFTGTLRTGTGTLNFTDGKIAGDQITFTAGGTEYSGRVSGNTVQGVTKGSSSGTWSATHTPAGKPAAK